MKEKTTAEFEIEVSGGQITCKQVIPDGKYKLVVEFETTAEDTINHNQEGIFKKVPASQLSLEDDFLKYRPKTDREQNFKNLVETAIKSGIKDFWRPVCDPSFDDNGHICFEPGKKPAVGKSYNWWEENAKKFASECGSRLGTKSEYVAFLAELIKKLVASGKSIEWAWNAVCNDSKELGHYWNSKNAKHAFEPAGSRGACGWYDLANSYKILAEDEEVDGLWLAGGDYFNDGDDNPLAGLCHHDGYRDDDDDYGCGWLVLEDCPVC